MSNTIYIYILNIWDLVGLVFIVYQQLYDLRPYPLYTYILNRYYLVWLGFIAYVQL